MSLVIRGFDLLLDTGMLRIVDIELLQVSYDDIPLLGFRRIK